MSEPTPDSYQAPQKSNRNAIIIALLSVVIVVQAIKIYLDSKEKQTINTDLTSTKQELATTEQRLREISTELDQKITEIKKLGGNVSDLEKAKADIEAELKPFQTGYRAGNQSP
jgi:cell division protein ZapB